MAPFVSPSSALLITSIYFPAGVKPDEMPENHSPFNLPNWCSLTSLTSLSAPKSQPLASRCVQSLPPSLPALPCLRVISWRQELRKWDDVARDG